jgi:hypothetical protein
LGSLAVAGCGGASSDPGTSHHALAPFDLGDPASNDTLLVRDVNTQCSQGAAACETASVSALDAARQGEGLPAIKLPKAFWSLSYDRQELILIDEERISRHLPPLVAVTAYLNHAALEGATSEQDPSFGPALFGWGSNWGEGPNTVALDLEMMYADGYIGPGLGNADCASIGGSGCWVHRRNILHRWPSRTPDAAPKLGAACVPLSGPDNEPGLSCATLFVDSKALGGNAFTWRRALQMGF